MKRVEQGELLRIHLGDSDRWEGAPLHEAIVEKARALGMAGATVFRAIEGFGSTAEVHKSSLLHRDQPLIVWIVDTPEAIARFVPEVEKMLGTGLLTISPVQMTRVEKDGE